MARCPCCGAAADVSASATSQSDLHDGLFASPREASSVDRGPERDTACSDAASSTLWVETNVLASCNAAYERARAAGAAEVTLFDLLHAICSAPTLTAWLAAYDIDGDLLRIEIEGRERDDGLAGYAATTPRTSAAMKSALNAARREAERRLAVNLTIGDVLTAIQETDFGVATRLLAAHIAHERQRRRGGARGWQADARGDLGALDRLQRRDDWTSVTREASNDAAAMHDTATGADWLTDSPDRGLLLQPIAHDWCADEAVAADGTGVGLSATIATDDDAPAGLLDDEEAEEIEAFTVDDSRACRHAAAADDGIEARGVHWQSRILDRLEVQALQLERLREELRGLRGQTPFASGTADAAVAATVAENDRSDANAAAVSDRAATPAIGVAAAVGDGNARQMRAAGLQFFLSRDRVRTDMRRTSRRRRQLSLAREREAAAVRQVQIREQQAREQQVRDSAQRMRMSVPPSAQGNVAGSPGARQVGKAGVAMLTGKADERALRAIDDDESDDIDTRHRTKRFYLSLSDDIVDAPSIGPKTAERLREHGINTVRDLLAVKSHVLSAKMGVRHITAERITSWQHQARLVCTIPWLRGIHAQILVGSGYYAPHSIVTANRDALCTAILRFATTREGQSVLRSSPPPSLGKIMRWVEQAAMAELDRAA